MNPLIFLTILVTLIDLIQPSKLPKIFQKCPRNTEDFNQCLSKSIEHGVHQLTKPYPNIGIPSLHPLEIPSMQIGEGNGVVNVVQNYKNVQFYGMTDIRIDATKMDFDKKLLMINATIPQIKQIAEYDFNGRILLLPIIGKGPSLLRLDNVKLYAEIEFDEVMINDKKYYKPIHTKILFNPDFVYLQFDNLFNGDKQLGDNINRVLNENWQDVYNDVKKGYEAVYADVMLKITMNIFTKIPVDDIFIN